MLFAQRSKLSFIMPILQLFAEQGSVPFPSQKSHLLFPAIFQIVLLRRIKNRSHVEAQASRVRIISSGGLAAVTTYRFSNFRIRKSGKNACVSTFLFNCHKAIAGQFIQQQCGSTPPMDAHFLFCFVTGSVT